MTGLAGQPSNKQDTGIMGGENRREIVPRALSPPPHPLLNEVASARRGISSNAASLVLNEFRYSIGCEHAPGEGGVEREEGKRGEGGDHRLASG